MKRWIVLLILCTALYALGAERVQVTIGDGSELTNYPFYVNFKSSLCETLYFQEEIGITGTITALSFYNDFLWPAPDRPVRIYLGNTDLANLLGMWAPFDQLSLVYEGVIDFPQDENTIMLGLDAPFAYTGGNLVLLVNGVWDNNTYHSYDYFQGQRGSRLRTRAAVDNDNALDPANPPTPYDQLLSAVFPRITLFFAAQPPVPEICFNPNAHDFGGVLLDTWANREFQTVNTGLADLTITGIGISGSPDFSLLGLPPLPLTLSGGESATFYVHYLPLAAEPDSATVAISSNTAQGLHLIPVHGLGVDPTIYTLPYAQNFDAVTPPKLPLDWSSYVDPQEFSQFVRTTADEAAPSQPNCLRMMNLGTPQGYVILISPPLAPDIPANSLEVTFQAQSPGSIYESGLYIGVITDPSDPESFVSVQYLDLETSAWGPHTVQLFSYQGTGRYIAFKHSQEMGYVSIKLDNIVIDYLAGADLAATAITGTAFPCVGSPALYQIRVANHGNTAQEGYQVQLLSEDGTLLGGAEGQLVGHGASVQAEIAWTPTQEGMCRLYGRVVLPGDANPNNDQTSLLQVTVLASGTSVDTIGEGNQQARIPFDLYRKNSLFETVIPADELNLSGTITGLQFYSNFLTPGPLAKPLKIWLGESSIADLIQDWIPSSQLQLVFDGAVELRGGTDIVIAMFSEPYAYQGGNLVLLAYRPWDNDILSSGDLFFCQTLGSNRARKAASDSDLLDPAAPPYPVQVQLSGQFPRVSFFYRGGSAIADYVEPAFTGLRISPNPSWGPCRISFDVKDGGRVKVEIFNLRGQLVRVVEDGTKQAGLQESVWDGLDARGRTVGAGIYLCRVESGDRSSTRKFVRLR